MCNSSGQNKILGEPIYTLAQSRKNDISNFQFLPDKMVSGNGSDTTDKKAWKLRARKKMMTQKIVLPLVNEAKGKGDLKRMKKYSNAFHCQDYIIHSNGRAYGNYCKTRFCFVCLGIRKAEIINKYLPTLRNWEDPHFITLTVKAVKKEKLKLWFKAMKVAFRRILDRCRKRFKKGECPEMIGIKSLECNFNPIDQTYNPHYHLIVPNAEVGNTFIIEWQRTWNKKNKKLARPFSQDKRRIYNLEKCLIEVIKYGIKVFTDPEMKDKKKRKIPPIIYIAAMDNIFAAMEGYRLFDRFGFNLPKQSTPKKSVPKLIQDYEEIQFDRTINDWVYSETGEVLTGYVCSAKLGFLLEHGIDKDNE